MFKNEDSYTLNTYLITNEPKAFSVMPFTVSIEANKAPKDVLLLPDETSIPFVYENGKITFKTRVLNFFDMYKIQF